MLSVNAQPSTVPLQDNYWRRIREADTRINASQITWKRIFTRPPDPVKDLEEMTARRKEWGRQRGYDEQGFYMRRLLSNDVEHAKDKAVGYTQTALYSLVHQGASTRCEVRSGGSVRAGAAPVPLDGYYVDFYDGKNIVEVQGILPSPEEKKKSPAKVELSGRLTRNGEILIRIGSLIMPFLVGDPLLSEFSPDNSSVREGAGNTLIMERRVPHELSPRLFRVTISKQTWRPVLMETINLVNNKAIRSFTLSGYKQHDDDIWFPNRVMQTDFRSDGRVSSTYDYHLLEAAFNQAADLEALKKPIPLNAIINDDRFAPRPSVPYKSATGAIPGDDKVLKLIEEREAMENRLQQSQQTQQRSKTLPFTLFLGIALIVAGVLLWRKSSRPAKT